jgi:eukaryotic translation initiation factor 2C
METQDLGGGLRALRGYFSSVRTGVNRILVNINVATGAFFKEGSLWNLINELGGVNNADQYKAVVKLIKKLNFETNYMTSKDAKGKVKMGKDGRPITKRKVHSVHTLSPVSKNATNITFEKVDASGKKTSITVQDYFKQQWNIQLKFPQAPLVDYNNKTPRTSKDSKWIPVELCFVLPGQSSNRLLKPQQTKNMLDFAARRPYHNAESIVGNGLQVTKINPGTRLNAFGIQVGTQLLTVSARVLPPPTLQYRLKPCTPANGSWNLDTRALGAAPFPRPGNLGQWNCLVIDSGQYPTIRGGFEETIHILTEFKTFLDSYGLRPGDFGKPARANVNETDLRNADYARVKRTLEDALKAGFKNKPSFILVILPNDNAVIYDSIKYLCDVELGVRTICCHGSKIVKCQPQYFANVAMKL